MFGPWVFAYNQRVIPEGLTTKIFPTDSMVSRTRLCHAQFLFVGPTSFRICPTTRVSLWRSFQRCLKSPFEYTLTLFPSCFPFGSLLCVSWLIPQQDVFYSLNKTILLNYGAWCWVCCLTEITTTSMEVWLSYQNNYDFKWKLYSSDLQNLDKRIRLGSLKEVWLLACAEHKALPCL